ncbi:dual-specificity RNA pseudouridine synthase RluA-like [Macrosteles quadrilineatus]|uniref:dual-specificity RNA pseudouridine synthase RluA-like n=1 Tax=Macrosteles quadrilineatus TaxID=74068 RepID=UPI0023E1DAFC|nr:dual-specificity RNA pseudouridine synthase RluA-like [Macrosteles quadrilineatus]
MVYIPPEPWLNIFYEDDYMIVVNKPCGLLSVPGRGNTPDKTDSVLTRVRKNHPAAESAHRLDLATSGVLTVALTKEVEIKLKDQFRRRRTYKFYIAKVWGHPTEDEGEIYLPIVKDWPNRPRSKVCYETGKPSMTCYKVLERYEDSTSRLLLTPVTGRSHQLRVHLQAIGHPIIGDRFYAPQNVQSMAPRLLLHAETLCLSHPHFSTPFHAYCKADF